MQIYNDAQPRRIAVRNGVTDEYVRQLRVMFHTHEMAPPPEALEAF
jgi:hypothetical protein